MRAGGRAGTPGAPTLRATRGLLSQLRDPRAIQGLRSRWAGAGADLLGGADEIIRNFLSLQPLYAIHGPPGTGKTTVVAHAVDAFLAAEPGARVLISAQANAALDNLAVRVVERVGAGAASESLMLRLGGESRGNVDPAMRRLQIGPLTERLQRSMLQAVSAQLTKERSPDVSSILRRWQAAIPGSTFELQERLRRGANIVFATTAGAGRLDDQEASSFGAFDWVIVEEAAKAWPTELALPLVLGVRWGLIGDHHQLPAYRKRDVEEVLDRCNQVEGMEEHYEQRETYRKHFALFESLFSGRTTNRPGQPLARLSLQFRMHRDIAKLASEFYDEPLKTAESVDKRDVRLTVPTSFGDARVVWLDTGAAGFSERVRWSNDGEAGLVAELVDSLSIRGPGLDDTEPIAVLTPWRQQQTAVRRHLADRKEIVQTVHAFQGREAGIVVVSLVRQGGGDRDANPRRLLGHCVQPDLVNVMVSRARDLLVLVGDYRHYREAGIPFWTRLCDLVKTVGVVVPHASWKDG